MHQPLRGDGALLPAAPAVHAAKAGRAAETARAGRAVRATKTVLAAVLTLSAGCGSDAPPVVVELAIGSTYDVTGVARELPDGQTPVSLRPLSFRYDMLVAVGGRLVGTLIGAGGQAEISGDFDAKEAQFTIAPVALALTSTAVEQVVELGAVGFDGAPTDGRIDELSGFLRVEVGSRAVQAYTVGVSRSADRPAAPDAALITARRVGLGRAQVTGAPGAIAALAGVEFFVHHLAISPPAFDLVQARRDGGFDVELGASEGDLIVVRARIAGSAGAAVVVTVGP